MAVDTLFLDVVDGALWVKVDRSKFRMYVWKGGTSVGVFSIEDGEELDTWPCEQPTAESAALAVAERTNSGY